MPTALQSIWMLSVGLAALSSATMTTLVCARLMRQRRDRDLLLRRKKITNELLHFALTGADKPVLPARTRHDHDLVMEAALHVAGLVAGESKDRISDLLRDTPFHNRLRKSARHGRVPERTAALEALRIIPGPGTTRTLKEAQLSPVFRVCLAAMRTGVEVGDLPTLSSVLKLTEQPEGGRSLSVFKVVEACVRADLPGALATLDGGLHTSAHIMMLKALGVSGSKPAFKSIAAAAHDADFEVRAAAITALRALGLPAALPVFVEATRDKDWRVRLKAVEGIGQFGSGADRASIEPLLNDSIWWIRFRAQEAMARLNERSLVLLAEVAAEGRKLAQPPPVHDGRLAS